MVSRRDPGINFGTVSQNGLGKSRNIFMAHFFWLASMELAEVHLATQVRMDGNHLVQLVKIGLCKWLTMASIE